ncbi:MAG: hypothetical protein GEV03_09135 [Streptosporangiales bacterium]|nr:hypothetical protein [Streptosporangiales bacterium]
MNVEIRRIAAWARKNGWNVYDTRNGYTHFRDPRGNWVTYYPATPSRPRARMEQLLGELNKAGLRWPPASSSGRRSRRRRGD